MFRVRFNLKQILPLFSLLLTAEMASAQIASEAWVQRYHGPGGRDDKANALAVDGGKVFVTGESSAASGTGSDYLTIAYSTAGAPLWTNRYPGPGVGNNFATAVKADHAGDVIVTGRSFGGTGALDYDFATVKYSSAGAPLWTNGYKGPADQEDRAVAVAVDGSNNVFVTGYSSGDGSLWDYLTIKYSSDGAGLWTNRYDGPVSINDRPYALAVDGGGNVFVTGYATVGLTATSFDFVTVAYSGAGDPLWTARYNGVEDSTDVAYAVAVDTNSSVFVTGKTGKLSPGGVTFDCATIKYSSAGEGVWTNFYNGPGDSDDQGIAIAVDAAGSVIVAGFSVGAGNYDFLTIKYSNDGAPQWTNRYNGPANGEDRATAVTVDTNGNVFVTGYSTVTNGVYDYLTIKYAPDGLAVWTNRYNGAGNSVDIPAAVAVDGSANVFVTGNSTGTNGFYDFATIKYSIGPAAIPLFLHQAGNQLVLTWTNAAFSLQSAPAVTGAFTNIPGATSPHTNALTGARQFFRLFAN